MLFDFKMFMNQTPIYLLSPRFLHEKIITIVKMTHSSHSLQKLATGGELFDRIVQRKTFSEKDARDVISKVCGAMGYLHARDIVHRDLKPGIF